MHTHSCPKAHWIPYTLPLRTSQETHISMTPREAVDHEKGAFCSMWIWMELDSSENYPNHRHLDCMGSTSLWSYPSRQSLRNSVSIRLICSIHSKNSYFMCKDMHSPSFHFPRWNISRGNWVPLRNKLWNLKSWLVSDLNESSLTTESPPDLHKCPDKIAINSRQLCKHLKKTQKKE